MSTIARELRLSLSLSCCFAYPNCMSATFDVIVVGAGAAGLMAAARAGAKGRKVLLLEHTDTIGAKILISGGGRCNFTNREIKPERFISQNLHFARSALARYTQFDFVELVERYQIAHYEKTLGQLFCEGAGAARLIVDMLLAECEKVGVTISVRTHVHEVAKLSAQFQLHTSAGTASCDSLIVASGGLSIPKLGATGFAYDIARQFDVPIIAPMPALVPLVFGIDDIEWMRPLAGVSLPMRAASGKAIFDEGMVFTHRGLSGPAILQVSSYWQRGDSINLDLLPDVDAALWLVGAKAARPKSHTQTIMAERLPSRLSQALCERAGVMRPLADIKDAQLRDLANTLNHLRLTPVGDEGYAKAEVTRGGIDTDALSQKTMEVKAVPGLYFIGEAVDVTGWLGGYNFQWAWSSGVAAGDAA
jgi:predicted Rossmann fold flavoprotein